MGRPEWGHGGPSDVGGYNNWQEDTAFFRRDGGRLTKYDDFFLSGYSQLLIDHGYRMLSAAASVFHDHTNRRGLKLSAKVAGVHWHYGTLSHVAELTASYYNTREREGYLPITKMIARHDAVPNFTCVEMKDWEQPWEVQCRPEALVKLVVEAAREASVEMVGENPLSRYDDSVYDQIVRTAMAGGSGAGKSGRMCGFKYLRMGPALFHPKNWRRFVGFVRRMKKGEGRWCLEEVQREAAPMVREVVVVIYISNL